ncbi:tryptophanyl-tRNA synthetase [Acidobacteria bacterium Mor1]|nr:tryptophanyl-tRNA synthetase [Acidobacteria bacterium Mor1]
MKKTVLSCIQPTGEMHIGNYFGAIKNWVALQDQYDCLYGVVDLHSMTMPYDPKELRANTLRMAIELLACGIDPERSILFVQSMVPEHTELNWVFNCVTSYGELSRMTQFKDKSEQLESSTGKFVSAGLFTYPVLQAADILVYRADFVPVGKDQEQHLELSRNIAVRFNGQFGDCFPEPQPLFTKVPKVMSLADPTKKMSKSLGDKHVVGLFEEEKSLRKKVKRAVTDTGEATGDEMSPGVANLFSLLEACEKHDEHAELMNAYREGALQYGPLKGVVADALVELTQGFIARKAELEKDPGEVERLIARSSERARERAKLTLDQVRKLTGLPVL